MFIEVLVKSLDHWNHPSSSACPLDLTQLSTHAPGPMGVKPQSFKSCNSGASDAPPKRRRVDKNSAPKAEAPAAPAVYVPKSAESENEEDDECYECGQGGNLTCCDVCPRVYHLRCLPSADSSALRRYEKQGVDADWWCPHCRRLLRASFALVRMISHDEPGSAAAVSEPPATPPAPRATTRSPDVSREMALSLFDFLADGQHEGAWAPLREAGAALAALLPSESAPWISLVDDDEGDGAAASPDGGGDAAAAAAAVRAAGRQMQAASGASPPGRKKKKGKRLSLAGQ